MNPQLIAKIGKALDPIIKFLPARYATYAYSYGRNYFMQNLYKHRIDKIDLDLHKWKKILWGIEFRLPLINAAGMFKGGEGYDLSANQGAGGYIGGTSTFNYRTGNIKFGITHPFLTLPKSQTSINFLGLPSLGDQELINLKITEKKVFGCPIGWSLMRSPDYPLDQSMEHLVESLWMYHNKPEIDFIELNESCPNIVSYNKQSGNNNCSENLDILENRLYYIANKFLSKRKRKLPVIIKLSNDLLTDQLPKMLDTVFDCKFDGITLGNTSTKYLDAPIIDYQEKRLFDFFTQQIGGGIGGKVLNTKSLNLCELAVKYREKCNLGYEFHVIRSGGISSIQDIIDSENAGISLNQWYTGYFENYIKYGDMIYARFFNN